MKIDAISPERLERHIDLMYEMVMERATRIVADRAALAAMRTTYGIALAWANHRAAQKKEPTT